MDQGTGISQWDLAAKPPKVSGSKSPEAAVFFIYVKYSGGAKAWARG